MTSPGRAGLVLAASALSFSWRTEKNGYLPKTLQAVMFSCEKISDLHNTRKDGYGLLAIFTMLDNGSHTEG